MPSRSQRSQRPRAPAGGRGAGRRGAGRRGPAQARAQQAFHSAGRGAHVRGAQGGRVMSPGAVGGHRAGLALRVPWLLSPPPGSGGWSERRTREPARPGLHSGSSPPFTSCKVPSPHLQEARTKTPAPRRVSQSFPDASMSPRARFLSPLISHLCPYSTLGRDGHE